MRSLLIFAITLALSSVPALGKQQKPEDTNPNAPKYDLTGRADDRPRQLLQRLLWGRQLLTDSSSRWTDANPIPEPSLMIYMVSASPA